MSDAEHTSYLAVCKGEQYYVRDLTDRSDAEHRSYLAICKLLQAHAS